MTDVKLLSGGNPQIAKGEGDGPVRAYIDAMPGWKKRVGVTLATSIERAVPGVHKAVKWNTPLFGIEGKGWFTAFHCSDKYVKVTFFEGAALDPVPPGKSKQDKVRYLDIREADAIDVDQIERWMKQASALPGARL
jgi:hypothetical protein